MNKSKKFSREVRERPVRMVTEHRGEDPRYGQIQGAFYLTQFDLVGRTGSFLVNGLVFNAGGTQVVNLNGVTSIAWDAGFGGDCLADDARAGASQGIDSCRIHVSMAALEDGAYPKWPACSQSG